MSTTFATVVEVAEEEWRLVFAGMVREYFEACVLPPPLNLLELTANHFMRKKMEGRRSIFAAGDTRHGTWGQHYIWPVPPLRFNLPIAMQARRNAEKDKSSQRLKTLHGKLDRAGMQLEETLSRTVSKPRVDEEIKVAVATVEDF